MSTPTTFTKLESMPQCDFATPDCFCSEHFSRRESGVSRLAQNAIALATGQEFAVNRREQSCPRGRIATLGKGATTTVWYVDSRVNPYDNR